MFWQWCRFGLASICLLTGIAFMLLAVFGVNRLRRALDRMHAAAMGDTLGILFVFLGLILMRGISFDSLKLFLVILFFWMASPVSGHMISRLEAMTDEELGEIRILRRDAQGKMDGKDKADRQARAEKGVKDKADRQARAEEGVKDKAGGQVIAEKGMKDKADGQVITDEKEAQKDEGI